MQTTLKTLLFVLVVATSIAATHTAFADGSNNLDPTEHQRITLLLRGYETPANAKTLAAAAVDPQAHLLAIVANPTSELMRLQALDGLSHFPNAKTLEVYTALVAKAGLTGFGSRALHRTIQGLAFGFNTKALPHLEPLLQHEDEQVRITVVHAMATLGESAKMRLREHLKEEKHPLVQETILKRAASIR